MRSVSQRQAVWSILVGLELAAALVTNSFIMSVSALAPVVRRYWSP